MAATSAVPMLYQVATNSGESRCNARHRASPPTPPTQPGDSAGDCRPGRRTWRKPISAAASSGSDISGIAVRQTLELLPTSRVIIGSRCGSIISH